MKHSGPVASVAYSPDGKSVLSGGDDGRHWVADGRKVGESFTQSLDSMTGQELLTSVAYSPNGLNMLTASKDRTMTLRLSHGETYILKGHTDAITSTVFSPDCSRIVSGSRDKSVKVWDVVSRQEVFTLSGHDGAVNSVAFTPDGKWIVSGSSDNSLKLWDATTGKEIRTLKGHAKGVNAVAISGNGKQIAISGNGKQIASGGDDKTLILWDVGGDLSPRKIEGNTGEFIAVAISPDGTRGVSSSKDQRAQVWDVNTLTPLISLGAENRSVGTTSTPQQNASGGLPAAGATDSKDQTLLTIDVPTRLAAFPVWSSDGKQIVAATGSLNTEGEVRVWNAEDGTEIPLTRGLGLRSWMQSSARTASASSALRGRK